MYNPGGIRLPKGANIEIKSLGGGMFSFANAYDGNFEYFEGRPLHTQDGLCTVEVQVELEDAPVPRES
ncbi:hypothetical protein [Gloeobacter morelensis]|uniref:Uncharacterized protein n=1 Tax=Gloeobacter morelensis MG652769 TaxID=2781736 RepID=A0ABY3PJ67_9CYAN|nr:hypothetical protein [Gloeobacter morelensis]UFP93603.1 hypothetical protein ISF26_17700 [Gloeobacter morelensis MG652769]